jgi:hypothetical protein
MQAAIFIVLTKFVHFEFFFQLNIFTHHFFTRQVLVQYRYRTDSISWSTPKDLLREIRVHWLQKQVLRQDKWQKFAIWNAGRDGRAFFRHVFYVLFLCQNLCFTHV